MRNAASLAGLAAFVVLVAGVGPAHAHPGDSVTVDDARVKESSGLALSVRHPHTVWTTNDSGDTARVLAIDTLTGRVTAEHRWSESDPRDVESIQVGPRGIYVGDTGDNYHRRDSVSIATFPEPALGETSGTATTWTLRYPDGAHDAETMLVHPRTGHVWIVTKSDAAAVYDAGVLDPTHREITLRRVAAAPPYRTDGVVLPDGRAVLRGYLDATVVSTSDWRDLATVVTPIQPQGEGIGLAPGGTGLLVSSEGRPFELMEMALPEVGTPSGSSTRATSTSVARPSSDPAPGQSTTPRSQALPPVVREEWLPVGLAVLGVAGLCCVLVGLGLARRRRGRRRR